MRHECECQHNARNIHYQDATGIFGVQGSSNGEYEKYKGLERNVQNAIEILSKKISGDYEELQNLINQTEKELEKIKELHVDSFVRLGAYNSRTKNIQYVENNPAIIFITKSDYDALSDNKKQAGNFLYAVGDFDASHDPYFGGCLFQRSYTIKTEGPGFDPSDNTQRILTIDLPIHELKEGNTLITEAIIEQLKNGFEWKTSVTGTETFGRKITREEFFEDLIEKFGLNQSDSLYIMWEDTYDLIGGIDYDLIIKYYEIWKDDEVGGAPVTDADWERFLQHFDPLGYYQLLDCNLDGKINAEDTQIVLSYASIIGTNYDDLYPLWVEYYKNNDDVPEHPVDEKEAKAANVYKDNKFCLQVARKQLTSLREKRGYLSSGDATTILILSAEIGVTPDATSAERMYELLINHVSDDAQMYDDRGK